MIGLWVAAVLAGPLAEPGRGVYATAQTVSLSASDGGALYYSLDGGAPTLPYSGPMAITSTALLRAVEQAADGSRSEELRASYLLVPDALAGMEAALVLEQAAGLEAALLAAPSISLHSGGALSYEESWASLEWLDGEDSEQLGAGLKRTGRTSVIYPKTSLRLAFRARHGPARWERQLFEDDGLGLPPPDSFDAMVLRSGNHDSVFYLASQAQYTRSRWMDDSQRAMGHLAPHGRFVHVYIDGAYTGVYHLRERFNADMAATYLGGEESDYELINGDRVVEGSGAGWAQVQAAVGYEELSQLIDIDQLLDYMLLNFYAANAWDWLPQQNWAAVGPSAGGPFRFQSYDNDICLVYGVDTDLLSAPGPSWLYSELLVEGHPDFLIALKDAAHRNLRPGGALSAEEAVARYEAISAELEPLLLAEAGQWGGGWWRPDVQWAAERERVLEFLRARGGVLQAQMEGAGWIDLPAPTFSLEPGLVEQGAVLDLSAPAGEQVWLRVDGGDPRAPGGEVAEEAVLAERLLLPYSMEVSARLRDLHGQWGPIERRFYEVDAAPPLVLNEWSAVEEGEVLEEGDPAWGVVPGNGGDWLELVVVQDHLDLRGWRLSMWDDAGAQGELVFTEDPLLADLRAGTLFTIAEELPEDPALDPAAGDWRFHLRAGPEGSGLYISAAPFDVSPHRWQLLIRDQEGRLRYGPVGEGLSPQSGLSGREVGALQEDPGRATRRDRGYEDADQSTFGAANRWSDQEQDLSALRPDPPPPSLYYRPARPSCAAAAPPARLPLALLGLLLALRRRGALFLLLGCADKAPALAPASDSGGGGQTDSAAPTDSAPEAADSGETGEGADSPPPDTGPDSGESLPQPEVCNGLDDDGDGLIDAEDPDLVDGLPFWADADGDGYGDEEQIVTACSAGEGATIYGGDCDDADDQTWPGAPEGCDGVDHNCDGEASTEPGSAADCPIESCAEALALGLSGDGPRWISLPTGSVSPLYCDLSTDGGGWTLAFLRNSASLGDQGSFGAGEEGLSSLAVEPGAASASSSPQLGWIDLNLQPWSELQLAGYAGGLEAWRSASIPRAHLRLSFGEPGYLLYGGDSPYHWCGGDRSYTDYGLGAVDNPPDAPANCKYHGGLGSGWDFGGPAANTGLTLCGYDGAQIMTTSYGAGWVSYGSAGGAQAIWLR